MKTEIYATLLHSISTDAKPQHSKCPAGENSWCFYQSAIANGEKPNNHKLNVGTPINEKFLPKILPIYQRLASNELLERCIRCGTQNANESLHSMIWAKCPKGFFVNKRRVKRAVTEAVCEYNKGTVRPIVETQKALGVATGDSTKQLATILDCRKQNLENVVKRPFLCNITIIIFSLPCSAHRHRSINDTVIDYNIDICSACPYCQATPHLFCSESLLRGAQCFGSMPAYRLLRLKNVITTWKMTTPRIWFLGYRRGKRNKDIRILFFKKWWESAKPYFVLTFMEPILVLHAVQNAKEPEFFYKKMA
ncbi:uncharacterized protein TNCV_2576771 [Trichonephila clavipes]|nr:uncharacterized protein TNCV_2576771 [Trichonephila clavipes]